MLTRQMLTRLGFLSMSAILGTLAWGAYLRLTQAGPGDWPDSYLTAELPRGDTAYLLALIGLGSLGWLLGRLAWQRRLLPGQPKKTPLAVMLFSICHIFLLSHPFPYAATAWFPLLADTSGLLLLLLLWWQSLRYGVGATGWYARSQGPADSLRPWALAVFVLVLGQTVFGIWVSLFHAGLSCVGFGQCLAAWPEPLNVAKILAPGSAEELEQVRVVLFLLHRSMALITLLAVIGLSAHILTTVFRCPALRRVAGLLLFMLPVQVVLGMSNLLSALPLWSVLSHLMLAILSLLSLVAVLHLLWPPRAHF